MKKSTLNKLLKLVDLVEEEDETAVGHWIGAFPFEGPVIIRTVTHYYTGKVMQSRDGFVILNEAAWIADTGRWSECLKTGTVKEVEPFPGEVAISLGSIIDVSPWNHNLPQTVK